MISSAASALLGMTSVKNSPSRAIVRRMKDAGTPRKQGEFMNCPCRWAKTSRLQTVSR